MSTKSEKYKGQTVTATAISISSGSACTVHYSIVKSGAAHEDDMYRKSGKVFATDEDALEAGIRIGKQLIDSGFRPTEIVPDEPF